MDIQRYKDRLMETEASLLSRIERALTAGRGARVDAAYDAGEQSVADQASDEAFTEGDRDSALLDQVRQALARIDNGTFGTCVVDGVPIETTRLEAMPWTPYCLHDAQRLEALAGVRTPTL